MMVVSIAKEEEVQVAMVKREGLGRTRRRRRRRYGLEPAPCLRVYGLSLKSSTSMPAAYSIIYIYFLFPLPTSRPHPANGRLSDPFPNLLPYLTAMSLDPASLTYCEMRMVPKVKVVDIRPPIIVSTDLSNFQNVVQKLTGKRKDFDYSTDCDTSLNKGTESPSTIESNGLKLNDGSISSNFSNTLSSDNAMSFVQEEVTSILTASTKETTVIKPASPSKMPKLTHDILLTQNDATTDPDFSNYHTQSLNGLVNMEFIFSELFSDEYLDFASLMSSMDQEFPALISSYHSITERNLEGLADFD